MEFFYREGRTLEEIGRIFHLSRERIRQILAGRGVDAAQGGHSIKAAFNASQRWNADREYKDARAMKIYGCAHAEVIAINNGRNLSDSGTPATIYQQQKKNALQRGIPWKFTLATWWDVWLKSGKWSVRGRGRGRYCMSRFADLGAYEPSNVQIVLNDHNCSTSYETKPSILRRKTKHHGELSAMQRKVAKLYGSGYDQKAIAEELKITVQTVKVHLASIKNKMGLYQRVYGEQLKAAA